MPIHTALSIVIATRERPGILADCLRLLSDQLRPNCEVIVVDNSPDDLSLAVARSSFVSRYIREDPRTDNVSNLKNAGVRYATGDLIALLDDDSLIQPGWVNQALASFSDPTVGGVTGRVIEDRAPEMNTPLIGRLSPDIDMIGNFNNLWPECVSVDFLHGCNMVWRREALQVAGGLDPWMSYSRGEQEWSLRVRQAGYNLLFNPKLVVHHLCAPRLAAVVQRAGSLSLRSRFIHCRSLTYQYARHFGPSRRLLKLTLYTLPKGDIWNFTRRRCVRAALAPAATLLGVAVGYSMAVAMAVGLHSIPEVIASRE